MNIKEKISKKFIAGVIASALTMTAGIIPQMTVSAEYTGLKYDDYLYYLKIDIDNDDVYDYVEITDCDETATEIVIPAEIDGLPVKSIGNSAFFGNENLKKIICPDSVEYLEVNAFAQSSINDIILSKNLKSIGYQCFWGCENLESIDLPDSLEYIEAWAFHECKSLKEIVIPDSVTELGLDPEGGFQFYDCTSLESVTFSKGLSELPGGMFVNCESLKTVVVPEFVTCIDMTFAECPSLESITIKNTQCEIKGAEFAISNDVNIIRDDNDVSFEPYYNGTIYGYKNSTAQEYAEKYGYKFESLGEYTPSWNVEDIIAFQNYLVKKTDSIGKNYDLNNDGKLNVFDLIILKRKVIYG